jgi:hypothetical protein
MFDSQLETSQAVANVRTKANVRPFYTWHPMALPSPTIAVIGVLSDVDDFAQCVYDPLDIGFAHGRIERQRQHLLGSLFRDWEIA